MVIQVVMVRAEKKLIAALVILVTPRITRMGSSAAHDLLLANATAMTAMKAVNLAHVLPEAANPTRGLSVKSEIENLCRGGSRTARY